MPCDYNPGYSGEIRVPLPARAATAPRRAVDHRAPRLPGAVPGVRSSTSATAFRRASRTSLAEEGVADAITLTVEQGVIGGRPASGNDFGAAVNYDAMIEQAAQFDFYDGGGLDIAFLSFAEVDGVGNVNVSRFSGRPNGSGGFIHIAQNAKAVCFLGTLTAGGLRGRRRRRAVSIEREGAHRRFVCRS